mmetsp:Transcript_15004/g.38893  ORF Transcript_15004/g.38893 Transcript_15004/m.38893 type:complete len:240 (-) Transcript_15004:128-847(-)
MARQDPVAVSHIRIVPSADALTRVPSASPRRPCSVNPRTASACPRSAASALPRVVSHSTMLPSAEPLARRPSGRGCRQVTVPPYPLSTRAAALAWLGAKLLVPRDSSGSHSSTEGGQAVPAARVPFGSHASAATHSASACSTATVQPADSCQTRTAPSCPPLASHCPSELAARARILCVWPRSVCSVSPLCKSHTRMVLSSEPLTHVTPSGMTATHSTRAAWPCSSMRCAGKRRGALRQ